MAETLVLEGTWEEIRAHESELEGKKVRLIMLPTEGKGIAQSAYLPSREPSTARSVLKHAGTWEGDDLEERLAEVYATRSKAKF
jgi:hypothetical protein